MNPDKLNLPRRLVAPGILMLVGVLGLLACTVAVFRPQVLIERLFALVTIIGAGWEIATIHRYARAHQRRS